MEDRNWDAFIEKQSQDAEEIRRLKERAASDYRAWFDPSAGKSQGKVDLLPPNLSGLVKTNGKH